jgi:NitT/TauT family transport system substrate-binding protein
LKRKLFIIFILIIICCLSLFFIFKKCHKKNNNATKITLAEVTHSTFYAPLYVALENGYFKDEGIDLELLLTPGADKVSAAVLSGDAQVGFAGAESAIYVYNGSEKNYLQIFSGLTKRDGQFIISRKNEKNFKLKDLEGKEVLVGRSTGMPALNFMQALKNEGVDISKVKINSSIDFASLSGAFISKQGDYVNLFEPNATLIEHQNYGYVVASIGTYSGEVPYTTFYAQKSYLNENKDLLKRFTKAINKGLEYVQVHNEDEIASSIKNQFKNSDINDLKEMIKRYKENDCWLKDSYVSEKLFTNLEDFLKENKLIKENVPYDDLVQNLK